MPEPTEVDRMFAFLRANLRARAVIATLRRWQAIENRTLNDVGQIIEQAPNPFVRVILEIIRHDSLVHHRVQQCLIDSLTDGDPMLAPVVLDRLIEDLAEHEPSHHDALQLAAELAPMLSSPLHCTLLDYLVEDVSKHQKLLRRLRELRQAPIDPTTQRPEPTL